MTSNLQFQATTVVLAAGLVWCGYLRWRWLRFNEDSPAVLISKWAISACLVLLAGMAMAKLPLPKGVPLSVLALVLMGTMWAPNIGSALERLLIRPWHATAPPCYSPAIAKRKSGKYRAAAAAVRAQLVRFPTDYNGMILLADMQANDLGDLPGAEDTMRTLLAVPKLAASKFSAVTSQLADWQLKYGKDPQAAQETLEEISLRFPGTHWAYAANQRIVHLPSRQRLMEKDEPTVIRIPNHAAQESEEINNATDQTEQRTREIIERLTAIPNDDEARVELAQIYSDFYQRLDLAEEQLEIILATPGLLPKQVATILNLMADLQLKHSAGVLRARRTLHRIIDAFPTSALAENAKKRTYYLRLQTKSQHQDPPVKLPKAEPNLGLKTKNYGLKR